MEKRRTRISYELVTSYVMNKGKKTEKEVYGDFLKMNIKDYLQVKNYPAFTCASAYYDDSEEVVYVGNFYTVIPTIRLYNEKIEKGEL